MLSIGRWLLLGKSGNEWPGATSDSVHLELFEDKLQLTETDTTEESCGQYLKSVITMWPELTEEDQQEIFTSVKKAKRLREMMTELAGIKKKVGE